MASPAKVTNIKIANIKPNPHNPRRLFDEEPLKILKESISNLGILVPLDVYPEIPNAADPTKDMFVLLDGERRLRCAHELNLTDVPCIIIETPSPEQNILTMFHIHNVREGWQLMPTALKLQELIKMLQTDNERSLAELTKLSISQVRRCKILLTYPVEFQEKMLAPVSERYKADFFIDLFRFRGPALEDRLSSWIDRGDNHCIEIMMRKYEAGVIKAVTEFRVLTSIYKAAKERNKINKFINELDKFFDNPDLGISDIQVLGATHAKEIKEVSRSTKRLYYQIESIDMENLSIDDSLIKLLKKLSNLINEKLDKALLIYPQSSNKEERD